MPRIKTRSRLPLTAAFAIGALVAACQSAAAPQPGSTHAAAHTAAAVPIRITPASGAAHVNPGAGISVSVAAAECMAADALTKIVFALREKAAGLLEQYHADGLLLERDGAPSWMFHSLCDTHDRIRFN